MKQFLTKEQEEFEKAFKGWILQSPDDSYRSFGEITDWLSAHLAKAYEKGYNEGYEKGKNSKM